MAEDILKIYRDCVTGLRRRGCRNPEDYVSDAFAHYYEKPPPSLEGPIGGWIYTVAFRRWLNDARSLRTRITVSGDSASQDGGTLFEVEAPIAPEKQNLDDFIQTLPPKLQETAILLSKCPSGHEVGQSLGLTRQAVNLRLKQIRERFNDFYGVNQ